MLPNCQQSTTLIRSAVQGCQGPHSGGLDAISDATSWGPPPPPCKVGNELHSIFGWFKVRLGWLVNAYSIHNAKEVGKQGTKGSFPGMQDYDQGELTISYK